MFCKLRSELKKRIKSEYECYVSGIERDIRCDSKSFWKFVKSRKRNEAGIPSSVTLNEEISHSTKESTELFAKHFGSVYCKNEIASEQDLADLYNIAISEVAAPMFLIHKKLCNLQPDKSSGPEDLPPM